MANLFLPYNDTKPYKLYDGILFPRNINSGKYICIIDTNRGESPTTKPSKWLQLNAIGSGTVTSVAASISGALSVSGSPITTTGTLAFTWTGTNAQVVLGDGTLGSVSGGGITTADNGLNLSTATNVQWGGNLLKNTTITASAFYSLFTGAMSLGASTGILRSENSGSSPSIYARNTGSGNSIRAISASGISVFGQSTSAIAGYFLSSSARGVYAESYGDYSTTTSRTGATTTGVLGVLEVSRQSSGGAGANDIGGSIDFKMAASNGGAILNAATRLISTLTDANIVSLSSRFAINNQNVAVDEEQLYLLYTGQLGLNKYTTSTSFASVSGASVGVLNVDNIGRVFVSTGGSGTVTSVNSGININVDNTNPAAPIINSLSDRYKTSSVTSNSVSNGSKSFTVDLNLSYIPLQEILVVYNASNHMHGEVTSYNSATGALVVDIKTHTGSGTYTSWSINLDGTPVDALSGSGTTNEIAYFTGAQTLSSLAVATYPSLTELSYVKGVSSAIQTQINGKLSSTLANTNIFVGNASNIATAVAMSSDATIANTGALTIANNAVTYAKMQSVSTTSRLLGSSSTTTPVQEITLGTNLSMSGTTLNATGGNGQITTYITGNGGVLTIGLKGGYTPINRAVTIVGYYIIGDVSGSVQVDIWKVAYSAIPTVANTIFTGANAGSKPTLSVGQVATVTLPATISVSAGDVFAYNIDSATTITGVTIVLQTT